MSQSTLPFDQISNWSDEKLLSVIASGERINWNARMEEDEEEWEAYVEILYLEKLNRKL